ncbi:hypothetical protein L1049_010534 [Liquidambar formosana]|uniref:Uncharacterized protein n=1 Tax=Liquidambar formosana TaxID=63359 RepID=A0AAP0R4D9_LIQFO
MARFGAMLLLFLVISASVVPSMDARKLLTENNKKTPSSSEDSLFFSSLPKGTVPASTPSKKGHDTVVDEKLIARHLASLDRILRSVPSPGVGH